MDAVYAARPAFRQSFLAVDMYAARMTQEVPDEETAYPYRGAVARLWVLSFPFLLPVLLSPSCKRRKIEEFWKGLMKIVYSLLDVGFHNASDARAASDVGRAARALFIPTSGASTNNTEVYVNYGHGDEGELGWYTARKLPRLRALKREYVPHGLFSNYNALG